MALELTHPLSDEARLALAYTKPVLRDALRIFLEFDGRLARLVSGTSEPMLGQMRLAWWRDTLGMTISERPGGDEVLDEIGRHWRGAEPSLVALVDGWENMLVAPPLTREAALAFAEGRARGLAGLANLHEGHEPEADSIADAGRVWAIADAVSHVSKGEERDTLLELGRNLPAPSRLSGPFRGVAVLGALGTRALAAGGIPLMSGRGAALAALRAGLLGR
jgi:phytoene synthase